MGNVVIPLGNRVITVDRGFIGFVGARTEDGCHVCVVDTGNYKSLEHKVCHSPDGFEWGYLGSGPAELSRCMLANIFGDWILKKPFIYKRFKEEVISKISDDLLILHRIDVANWFLSSFDSMRLKIVKTNEFGEYTVFVLKGESDRVELGTIEPYNESADSYVSYDLNYLINEAFEVLKDQDVNLREATKMDLFDG